MECFQALFFLLLIGVSIARVTVIRESEPNTESQALKRQARQAPIVLPPEHINRFEHSMVNNNNLRPVDIASNMAPVAPTSRSRSYVYKNQGGKGYIYAINHNEGIRETPAQPQPEAGELDYNDIIRSDAENVGPIRPPDLSRDLRVNPNGNSNNQGASIIDPDSEVFDLSLVIKEMESRANDI